MNEYESIIQIGDILVSGDVVTEFFCCDYEKCKGCCCVIGDSGAPLEESEIEEIELPETLVGEYELQILRGNFCFYATIEL